MCRSSEAVYFRAITNSVLFKLQFVLSLIFLFRDWREWHFNFRKHHLLLLSISLTSSLPTWPEAPNTRQFGAGEGSDAIFWIYRRTSESRMAKEENSYRAESLFLFGRNRKRQGGRGGGSKNSFPAAAEGPAQRANIFFSRDTLDWDKGSSIPATTRQVLLLMHKFIFY